jgi:hypothetical protein
LISHDLLRSPFAKGDEKNTIALVTCGHCHGRLVPILFDDGSKFEATCVCDPPSIPVPPSQQNVPAAQTTTQTQTSVLTTTQTQTAAQTTTQTQTAAQTTARAAALTTSAMQSNGSVPIGLNSASNSIVDLKAEFGAEAMMAEMLAVLEDNDIPAKLVNDSGSGRLVLHVIRKYESATLKLLNTMANQTKDVVRFIDPQRILNEELQ